MATYKINATIFINWHNIKSKEDALDEIQQMLDSYYYDNKSDPADVLIKYDSVSKVTAKEMEQQYGL